MTHAINNPFIITDVKETFKNEIHPTVLKVCLTAAAVLGLLAAPYVIAVSWPISLLGAACATAVGIWAMIQTVKELDFTTQKKIYLKNTDGSQSGRLYLDQQHCFGEKIKDRHGTPIQINSRADFYVDLTCGRFPSTLFIGADDGDKIGFFFADKWCVYEIDREAATSGRLMYGPFKADFKEYEKSVPQENTYLKDVPRGFLKYKSTMLIGTPVVSLGGEKEALLTQEMLNTIPIANGFDVTTINWMPEEEGLTLETPGLSSLEELNYFRCDTLTCVWYEGHVLEYPGRQVPKFTNFLDGKVTMTMTTPSDEDHKLVDTRMITAPNQEKK